MNNDNIFQQNNKQNKYQNSQINLVQINDTENKKSNINTINDENATLNNEMQKSNQIQSKQLENQPIINDNCNMNKKREEQIILKDNTNTQKNQNATKNTQKHQNRTPLSSENKQNGEKQDKKNQNTYSKSRLKKIIEIEKFLLEETAYIPQKTGIQKEIKFLEEKDYHIGDFVFQLYNPDYEQFKFQLQKYDVFSSYFQKMNQQLFNSDIKTSTKIKMSEISQLSDLTFFAETPYEQHRLDNELLMLAINRIVKRISDFHKMQKNQKSKLDNLQVQTNQIKMLYYSSKSLKIFEKMPDLPKNRKANMNYRKKNIIVLDNGTANYLKNEIKIEGGNAKKQLEKNRSYMIKNDKDQWVRTGNPINDFTTLFRNFFIYKLTQQGGFKVRQFISKNGEFIFLILFAGYENLKIQASQCSFNKEVSFCQTDIFSLEPVDKQLRPLRLNHKIRIQKYEQNISKFQELIDELKQKKHEERNEHEIKPLKELKIFSDQENYLNEKYKKIKYQHQANEIDERFKKKRTVIQEKINQIEQNIEQQFTEFINQQSQIKPFIQNANIKKIGSSRSDKRLFQLKLDIFKNICEIDFQKLQNETRCSNFINSSEEILYNSNEDINVFIAYNKYLQILKEKILKIRKEEKDPIRLSIEEIQKLFSIKYKIKNQYLEQRIQKHKTFILQKFTIKNQNQYEDFQENNEKNASDQVHEQYLPAFELKKLKEYQFQQKLQNAFLSALKEAKNDKQHGKYIKTIWDSYGLMYNTVTSEYLYPEQNKSVKYKIKQENLWSKQCININRKQDLFTKMQRIKLLYGILVHLVDFSSLKNKYNLIHQYFPLHDQFLLTGQDKYCDMFKDFVNDFEQKKQQISHFIDSSSNNILVNQNYSEKIYQRKKEQFKDKVLLIIWKKNRMKRMILSWRIPEDQIREYFGEKVALYFIFLAFYIKYSFPAALFGVFLFLIHLYVDGNETSVHGQIITILFTFLIVLWGNIVCGKWKLVECQFTLKYGMSDIDDSENIRPGFVGQYARSIISNKPNELNYDKSKTLKVEILAWLLIAIVLAGNLVIIFYLLIIQKKCDEFNYFEIGKTRNSYNILIPTLGLQFIFSIGQIFQNMLIVYSCNKANYKTHQDYEQSYAQKAFVINMFNNLVPPTLIAFIIQNNIKCVQDDCFYHLKSYVRSYQYSLIIKQVSQALWPLVKGFLNYYKLKKLQNFDNKILTNKEQINNQIESESMLQTDQKNSIDNITLEYINITSYFCFNVTYGLGFSLVYIITLLICFLKLLVGKKIYTQYQQRPIPQNATTIGIFKQFMDLGSSISILTYSGIFCFTSTKKEDWNISQLYVFMMFILFFFAVKFGLNRFYEDIDTKTQNLLKRQAFIQQKTFHTSKDSNKNNKMEQIPLFKVYGSFLEESQITKKQQ